MTHAQAVEELLQKCETLLAQGDARQASMLLDKILRLDFANARAWRMLHGMLGRGQPFEAFQREFARKYYPARAYLLETLDLIPLAPPEAAPGIPPAAPSLADEAQPHSDGTMCAYCGRYNPPGQPVCLVCGANLAAPGAKPQPEAPQAGSPPTVDVPATSAGERADELVCPKCQHRNELRASFCTQCGTSLLQADYPAAVKAQPAAMPVPAPNFVPPEPQEAPWLRAGRKDPRGGYNCPACGHFNPVERTRCASCDFDLIHGDKEPQNLKEEALDWLRLIWQFILLLLFLGFAGLFIVYIFENLASLFSF